MTPVEYLAKELHRIRLEVESENYGAIQFFEQSEKALEEAIEKEKGSYKRFYIEGVMSGIACIKMGDGLDFEQSFNELYKKFTI